jgi:chromosome segregation protein
MRGDVKRFLSFVVGDDINPRFTFSSGQRRALGLAFLLAVYLSRPWCKLRTLVLDDPIQHIDDYRALHLAEVLSSIRQLGHQVVCTVEDPNLAELLCRRLRSQELGDGLKVELEYEPGVGAKVKEVSSIAPLPERLLLTA